jgi:hypothetical protein
MLTIFAIALGYISPTPGAAMSEPSGMSSTLAKTPIEIAVDKLAMICIALANRGTRVWV